MAVSDDTLNLPQLKYRPKKFAEMIGQHDATEQLTAMLKDNRMPHCLLFVGPSGTGKTTLARILKRILKCSDRDFLELNAAKERGIDALRDITKRMHLAPFGGKCRIYLIDECHALTPQAQESVLKALEDTPKHVYFFLCTTDAAKLKRTIITRSTKIKLNPLTDNNLLDLLEHVTAMEKREVDEDVLLEIVKNSDGSARQALVHLNQVIGIEDPKTQLNFIRPEKIHSESIDIARALIAGKPWSIVADHLQRCESDPEQIRWLVLKYAATVTLGGGEKAARAFLVLDAFRGNFYDSKFSGLVHACYEVVEG